MKTKFYYLLITLGMLMSVSLSAQDSYKPLSERIIPVEENEEASEYIPAEGDILIYEVKLINGLTYDFIVKITRYDLFEDLESDFPVAFDWKMTEPINTMGKVEICRSCLSENINYTNYFKNGEHLKLTNATTVFMSGRNFYEPNDNDDRMTTMVLDGQKVALYDKHNYYLYPVLAEGKEYSLVMSYYNSSPDMDGETSVGVQALGGRVILYMNLAFNIRLKEIRSEK